MILHWAIAGLLAFQIGMGFGLESVPSGSGRFEAFQLHKSLGFLILLLSVARVAVRLLLKRPEAMPDAPWARTLSRLVHSGLYLFMIATPLTGWIMASASRLKVPTVLFDLVPLPHLPVGEGAHDIASGAHETLAIAGAALIVLHIAGALRHQFAKGQALLARMMPIPAHSSSTGGVVGAAAGIALVAAGAIAGNRFPARMSPPWLPEPRSAEAIKVAPVATSPAAEQGETGALRQEEEAAAQDPQATDKDTPVEWTIDPGGRLDFTAEWTGTPVDGQFAVWRADVRLDPEDPSDARIAVTIDLASASTGDSQRDEMLKGEAFFDVSRLATARFTATDVTRLSAGRFRADGTLSLRGQSKPVRLSFTIAADGADRAKVAGIARLKRSQFGVGQGEWSATDQIADEDRIDFRFTTKRR